MTPAVLPVGVFRFRTSPAQQQQLPQAHVRATVCRRSSGDAIARRHGEFCFLRRIIFYGQRFFFKANYRFTAWQVYALGSECGVYGAPARVGTTRAPRRSGRERTGKTKTNACGLRATIFSCARRFSTVEIFCRPAATRFRQPQLGLFSIAGRPRLIVLFYRAVDNK